MEQIPLQNIDESSGRTRVESPPPDLRRTEWLEWWDAIHRDLTDLTVNRMVWRAFTAIWEDRDPPLPDSFLFTYLARTYVHSQVMGVRRLVDPRKDVRSFVRLLMDIEGNVRLISREYFVGRYEWGHQWLGDEHFQEFDPHETGYLDPGIVKGDIRALKSATEDLTNWANHHVAHIALMPTSQVPTFNALDTTLDQVESIWKRWTAILKGFGLLSITPVPQYDWLAPLKVPWITSEAD